MCDGCRSRLLLDAAVWSDVPKNRDFCRACYAALPRDRQSPLVELAVYHRCGVRPPTNLLL